MPRLRTRDGATRRYRARLTGVGAVLISRAYGAWYESDEATAAFSEGLDPVFVPPLGPGNVPTTNALIAEGMAIVRQGSADLLAISGDDRVLALLSAAEEEELPVARARVSVFTTGQ